MKKARGKQIAPFQCPHCEGEIPGEVIAGYAARRAMAMRDPESLRHGGRPRTVKHKPKNPRCPCSDCRKARTVAAQERRAAKHEIRP